MNKHVISLLFLLSLPVLMHGQREARTEILVSFRIGSSELEPSFEDNALCLSQIIQTLQKINRNHHVRLVELSFSGSASPDGSMKLNKRLAEERLHSLKSYICERVDVPDNVIKYKKWGIDWKYLEQLVVQSDVTYKQEILRVLREVPEYTYDSRGVLIDSRKQHLMELKWGRVWHDMDKRFFKQLRNSCAVIISVKHEPVERQSNIFLSQTISAMSVNPVSIPKMLENKEETMLEGKSNSLNIALKTNLLYDAVAVPNIGMEVYLGKQWSVAGNWMYAWWNKNGRHRYWRIYGGDIAIRKWLGRKVQEKPLAGHHIGIYGQLFTYDMEFGGKGYMGGRPGASLWEKMNCTAGVEYGYSLPITRHLNLDFCIGVGYWGGEYYEYTPIDGHYVWQATKKRQWFGPTKAEVSLVWLLGKHNINKEGGRK